MGAMSDARDHRAVYLHEEDADDESRALAVAHLAVVQRVRFHHVEQALLAEAVLLLEELVLRVSAGYVAPDHLQQNEPIS